jgi:hypothetical protein
MRTTCVVARLTQARNVGNRKGAELATYIVLKGEPLLSEVGDSALK